MWHLEDEIGTLTPGKQADTVVIDMRSPHLDGFGDPVAVMVLGAGPADVETVIVGGDVVKRDGDNVDHPSRTDARRPGAPARLIDRIPGRKQARRVMAQSGARMQ